ncbi:MAG TPA: two-component regulator propeller domain-containing protein [Flavitalea sp.]|nr:two-component regulator propeller domain-containing protein [Flavitalea sp.]
MFSKNKICLLIAFLKVLSIPLGGQTHYYFKHYEVEHGLSNNIVLSSLQDQKGFMWFGTIDGLNRFDGYTFQTFRHNPADPSSIGNNSVYSIRQGENEMIWFATNKGLYKYNPVDQKFVLIPYTRNHKARSIFIDNTGELWFTISKKLSRYNDKSKTYMVYDSGDLDVSSICDDDEGNIWVATTGGLLKKYNRKTNTFMAFDMFKRSDNPSSRYIEKIFNTQKGYIIVGTLKEGIKLFDIAKGEYQDLAVLNKDKTEVFAKDFMRYSENEYWIASETGIFIYNIITSEFVNFQRDYNNSYSLSDNAINTLFKDNEGGIWAGTRFGGVSYSAYPYNHFEKYFSQGSTQSIGGNGVHEICHDKNGNIWIGTEDGGLNKMNRFTGQFKHFISDGKKGSISYSNIHGLLVTGDELWIGTYQYGLDRMDLKTEKVTRHYKAGKNSFKSNFIVHLFQTRDGEIMVGTWEGLYRYNKLMDNFELVRGFDFQTQSIVEDENGLLWICTLGNGVFTLDRKTCKIENYKNDPDVPNTLSSNMVNGQFIDRKGNHWFATEGGLSKLDTRTRSFQNFTIKDGLPSNFLFKILEDNQNNLWISSTRGLVKFNPYANVFKTFTTANGLLNDQFNWNSAYKDSSGRMYFGSVKGMISFIPGNLTVNTNKPPVYITGIQINNKDIPIDAPESPLKKSITYTDKIVLGHKQSTFSIDFAVLSYISPDMNEYAYKMEGLDKEWTTLKARRKAYFTELPPGDYHFRVKASNNSGIWNNEEATLNITILPPFWASKWAYILYLFVSGLVIWVIVRNYHKRVSEKNQRRIEQIQKEKENELYRNKIEFFTNIAHEIRTPLTLIQGPMEDILCYSDEVPEIRTSLKIMERNTNRLLAIANQLLDFRQTEAKGFSLNFQKTNIAELLIDLHTSFKPLAVQHKLDFRLELTFKNFFAFVDVDSVQKIIGNLYSNAIKYAGSFVCVTFVPLFTERKFRIEFRNDGYLIPYEMKDKIFEPFFRMTETSNQKGTGIGLAISKTLTELNKGTLKLEESKDDTNVFALELFIHKNARDTEQSESSHQAEFSNY